MKIRTQLIATISLFGAIIAVIALSTIITNRLLERSNIQERISADIAIGASELGYLSNDYLIYHEAQQLARWQSKLTTFSALIASLSVDTKPAQALTENIRATEKLMKAVFNSIAPVDENPIPERMSTFNLALFKVSWSRMAIQCQALLSDASRLSFLLDEEQNSITQSRSLLMYIMLGLFGAILVGSYIFSYRGILGSIKKLRAGTEVIGTGNLDFVIDVKHNDELGELSRAFNFMILNLKNVTASKSALEDEITERIQVEQYLAQARDNLAYDLEAMTRLQEIAALFVSEGEQKGIFEKIVDAAITITGADMGNIQLLDEEKGFLKIAAHRGFDKTWLDFWDHVSEGMGAGGAALASGERVVIEDVTKSPIFIGTDAMKVHLNAGVKAIQSTPLMARSGMIIGIASTYFRTPTKPKERELRMLDLLARQVADIIERISLEKSIRESELKYRVLFNSMSEGFALHEIVCNETGEACDYKFIEMNSAFERLTDLKRELVLGKMVKDVLPDIEPFWVETYGKVALTGQPVRFENYSAPLKKHYDVIAYSPAPMQFAVIFMDITERKTAQTEQQTTIEFLSLLNRASNTKDLIQLAVIFIQNKSGCEAVGIRLKQGDDYPYYEVRGFTKEFVELENSLCARDVKGDLARDRSGNPIIECMCGNVICGRFDSSKPFFTQHGSFWSNNTTELLANTTEEDRQARTRNRCNGEGYESVALIPIHSGEGQMGLMQLNDKRKDMFTIGSIIFWERLADYFAIALAKFLAEDKLQESEERYATTLGSIGDAVIATDIEGNITFMNTVAEQLTGWKFPEAAHMQLSRVFHIINENTRSLVPSPIEKVLELGTIVGLANHTILVRKDGKEVPIDDSGAPIKNRSNSIIGVVLIFRDITERKRAEEALRKSEANFRSYFEMPLLGIAITAPNRSMVRVNDRLCDILGYKCEDLLEITWDKVTHPDDKILDIEKFDLLLSGAIDNFTIEKRCIHKNGKSIPTITSVGCVRKNDRSVDYFVEVVQDISLRKQAETEMLLAKEAAEKANRTKGQFIANLSHELRTPLNSVLGYSQLLLKAENLNEKQKANIEGIYGSGRHLLAMINDLLDLSKIEAEKMVAEKKAFHLPALLTKVSDNFFALSEEKNLAFEFKSTSDIPVTVIGDETRLNQILLNLLSNAVKFTDEGKIILQVGILNTAVSTDSSTNKIAIRFEVSDTGIGIPEEELENIFNSFQQLNTRPSKTKGTGLGLTISRSLARLMEGELYVRSEVGKGSTFWLDLNIEALSDERVSMDFINSRVRIPTPIIQENLEVPPEELLRRIYSLAKIGDISELRRVIALIESENPQYNSFISQLKTFAKNIQLKEIELFILNYISESKL